MLKRTTLATLALLAACGGGDAPAMDAAEEAMPADMMEAGVTVADFAGTWDLMAEVDGAEAPVAVQIMGTAEGQWTMMLEGREPLAAAVEIVGDSLVMNVAEYESVLRAGVMVGTRSAVVMDGDMMIGTLVATYATPEGDEVVGGTIAGRRAGM